MVGDTGERTSLGIMFWVWSWGWLMKAHISGQMCGTVEAELDSHLSKREAVGAL